MPDLCAQTLWIQPPTANVAVVIISSAQLPTALGQSLKDAIKGWDEVAWLHVHNAEQLHRQWLDSQGSSIAKSEATHVLGALHKHCVLLDIETGHRGELAWLGSVGGHPLRYLELAPDAACSRILETLSAQVKQHLHERFLAC